MTTALAIVLSVFAAPATDFDWSTRANRAQMDVAFSSFAERCTIDLGFTRQPKLPADTMADKIDAHLLLQASADGQIAKWAEILRGWHALSAGKETLAQRSSEAVLAAVADPDRYTEAEALYVDALMAPLREMVEACSKAAADPFVGRYYVTGRGSADRWRAKLKDDFSKAVDEMTAYKASLKRD